MLVAKNNGQQQPTNSSTSYMSRYPLLKRGSIYLQQLRGVGGGGATYLEDDSDGSPAAVNKQQANGGNNNNNSESLNTSSASSSGYLSHLGACNNNNNSNSNNINDVYSTQQHEYEFNNSSNLSPPNMVNVIGQNDGQRSDKSRKVANGHHLRAANNNKAHLRAAMLQPAAPPSLPMVPMMIDDELGADGAHLIDDDMNHRSFDDTEDEDDADNNNISSYNIGRYHHHHHQPHSLSYERECVDSNAAAAAELDYLRQLHHQRQQLADATSNHQRYHHQIDSPYLQVRQQKQLTAAQNGAVPNNSRSLIQQHQQHYFSGSTTARPLQGEPNRLVYNPKSFSTAAGTFSSKSLNAQQPFKELAPQAAVVYQQPNLSQYQYYQQLANHQAHLHHQQPTSLPFHYSLHTANSNSAVGHHHRQQQQQQLHVANSSVKSTSSVNHLNHSGKEPVGHVNQQHSKALVPLAHPKGAKAGKRAKKGSMMPQQSSGSRQNLSPDSALHQQQQQHHHHHSGSTKRKAGYQQHGYKNNKNSGQSGGSSKQSPGSSGSNTRPALSCCGKMAKLLLFITNISFWSAGIALGAWGILSLVDDHKYNISQLLVFEPNSRMSLFQLLSWSFITLGCATVLVGFCGCSAILKNNRWILGLYIFLILAIFALDLATGLLAIIFQEKLVANIRLRLVSKLRSEYGVQASFTAAIDYIQTRFECCGLEGHFDYDQSLWRLQRLGGFEATVARTCCHLRNSFDDQAHINPRPVNESMCQSTDVRFHQSYRYRKGCLDDLERLVRQKIWTFTIGCVAVGGVILLSLIFATCFCRSIPSPNPRKNSNQRDKQKELNHHADINKKQVSSVALVQGQQRHYR